MRVKPDPEKKKMWAAASRKRNREKINAKSREYYAKNKERILKRGRERRAENRGAFRAYRREHYKAVRDKISEASRLWYQTKRGKYVTYKRSSKTRGIIFSLTEEEFYELWGKPCSYCGSDIKTIGIDRVDNESGYVSGNIVPCCFTCNDMKRKYSKDMFVEHVLKIADHQSKGAKFNGMQLHSCA